MITPLVVVIAKSELVPPLRKRLPAGPAVAVFPVSESLRALEAILERPPKMLALDSAFLTTARGASLVARVQADPQLTGIDVRVLPRDEAELALVLSQQAPSLEDAMLTVFQPLDRCGTRRAVRFSMKPEVGVVVNGNPSQLIDLSVTGAQVLAPTRLQPDQSVRIALINGSAQTNFRGLVAWSAAELAGAGVQYRAGVEFTDPDPQILEAFCLRHAMGTSSECTDV